MTEPFHNDGNIILILKTIKINNTKKMSNTNTLSCLLKTKIIIKKSLKEIFQKYSNKNDLIIYKLTTQLNYSVVAKSLYSSVNQMNSIIKYNNSVISIEINY